jgi:hypothetical protein
MSEKKGIIRSDRTFGIELEVGTTNDVGIPKLYSEFGDRFHFTRDGSIQAVNPIEIVSPVLRGAKGEDMVRKLCKRMAELQFFGEDPSCGFHAHLGGEGFLSVPQHIVVNEEEYLDILNKKNKNFQLVNAIYVQKSYVRLYYSLKKNPTDEEYLYCKGLVPEQGRRVREHRFESTKQGVKYFAGVGTAEIEVGGKKTMMRVAGVVPIDKFKKIKDDYRARVNEIQKRISAERSKIVNRMQSRGDHDTLMNERSKIEGLLYGEQDKLDREYQLSHNRLLDKGKGGKFVCSVIQTDTFKKLKTLFYFYVAYDEVIKAMLPTSRKEGNNYCRSLTQSYNLDNIEKVATQEELEECWYKTPTEYVPSRKSERRDPSRYHGINLHSLFSRYHTVEIRYHSGETDADRILFWVALHQFILDKIESGEVTIEQIKDGVGRELEDQVEHFLRLLQMPKHLNEYVKRLVNYFK